MRDAENQEDIYFKMLRERTEENISLKKEIGNLLDNLTQAKQENEKQKRDLEYFLNTYIVQDNDIIILDLNAEMLKWKESCVEMQKENDKLKEENNNLKKDIEMYDKFDRRSAKDNSWYIQENETLKAENRKLELLLAECQEANKKLKLKLFNWEKRISDLDFPPSRYSISIENANKDKKYLQEVIKERDSIIVNHLEKIKQLEDNITRDNRLLEDHVKHIKGLEEKIEMLEEKNHKVLLTVHADYQKSIGHQYKEIERLEGEINKQKVVIKDQFDCLCRSWEKSYSVTV